LYQISSYQHGGIAQLSQRRILAKRFWAGVGSPQPEGLKPPGISIVEKSLFCSVRGVHHDNQSSAKNFYFYINLWI
jgi:hypothetical protein